MIIEIWKIIPNTDEIYQASDQGRIRSLDRIIAHPVSGRMTLSGKVLTPVLSSGYHRVTIRMDGVKRPHYVHRLVLLAFVGEPSGGQECCHSNGNPLDNRLDNLRWDTRSSNNLDAVKHGRSWQANKQTCLWGHLLEPPNLVVHRAAMGHRACLACSRASKAASAMRLNGRSVTDEQVRAAADLRYQSLMPGAA